MSMPITTTAILSRNEYGSVRIRFRALQVPGQKNLTGMEERLLSAKIYDVAAEMEGQAGVQGVTWAISPSAFDRRIDIEGGEDDLPADIEKFARRVLADKSISIATETVAKSRRAR